MGVELVEGRDLVVRDGVVYMRTTEGERRVRRGLPAHRRRVPRPGALPGRLGAGVPGIVNAARAGNVTIANAVGNGVADDKLLYTYVPDIIRYYLDEEPMLAQRRHLPARRTPTSAARCSTGSTSWCSSRSTARAARASSSDRGPTPRRWRAARHRCSPTRAAGSRSRWCSCRPHPRSSTATLGPRHVDLRPFAVNDGERVWVLPGGLTRVALREGTLIVNSSQGGGSKDTWVLSGHLAETGTSGRSGGEHHRDPRGHRRDAGRVRRV